MPNRPPAYRPPSSALPRRRSEPEAERRAFYNSTAWVRLRDLFIREHPLCARCDRAGRITAATLVHHVIERLVRPDLALDAGNLESSCDACHTRHHKSSRPSPRA